MAPEAQRRDTPAEGLPAVQHVEENGDHFVLTFANGKSTVVHKEGLQPETLAHIQGMAHGGLVISSGGSGIRLGSEGSSLAEDVTPAEEVKEEAREKTEAQEQDKRRRPMRGEEIPQMLARGGEVDAGAPGFQPLDFLNGTDAGAAPPPVDFWTGNAAPPPAVDVMPAPDGSGFVSRPDAGSVALTPEELKAPPIQQVHTPSATEARAQQLAEWQRRNDVTPRTPGSENLPPGWSLNAPGAILGNATSVQPPSGAATPPSGQTQAPSGSGALSELNRGLAEQQAGLAAQVETEKARDAALLELQDKHIAQMQAMEAQQAEQMALHQRRADDLFQAVLNSKIDPNRVWANADLGQRIGAGIGILLSGIGQGLGGGPNMALQVIDRIVDQDIDAQKTNLENQKGLLSYYLQQGRDMLSAHALAKADLKDMLAAQVTRVSAEFGGQEAAARAQLVGGQLRTEAAGKRQEILARQFQMDSQRAALGAEMERNRLISQFAAQGRGGEAGILELLPEKVRARFVRLPNGKMAPATDDSAAKKYREASQATDKMRRTLQRYRAVLESGHPWIPSGVGGDRTTAEALRAELILNLKDMNTLGALQPGELRLIEPMVPDITDTFTRDDTLKQGLDALGHTIEDRVNSNMQAFLE